jgi:hypothetical protein
MIRSPAPQTNFGEDLIRIRLVKIDERKAGCGLIGKYRGVSLRASDLRHHGVNTSHFGVG